MVCVCPPEPSVGHYSRCAIKTDANAVDVIPQRLVSDAGEGLDVEAVGQRKIIQFASDRLRLQRCNIALDGEIDV